MKNLKKHVYILDINGKLDKNNPDHEGVITGELENYYLITNLNMPYCGTFSGEPIPKNRVVIRGNTNE